MNSKTPEYELFEYLRDILYYPNNAQLDLNTIPENMQELAEGLLLLGSYIQENNRFMTSLANGDLSCPLPNVENTVAAAAKSLHSSLVHLTWQTKRVAMGDFNQHVDFMGEFSEAFNYMIDQLKQAKELEKRELAAAKQRVLELSQAEELFMDMAEYNCQLVVVTDISFGKILFSNRKMTDIEKEKLIRHMKTELVGFENRALHWEYSDTDGNEGTYYFSVSTHATTWNGKSATAHMITDITVMKNKEDQMQQMAYVDALTGVYNRRYGMDYMTELKAGGKMFSVAFCDLDNLKFCNDNFGHEEGNRYIVSCCEVLSGISIKKIICRTGGDEFLVICDGIKKEQLEAELQKVQLIIENKPKPSGYTLNRNISFGVAQSSEQQDLDETLADADMRMYEQKRAHKLQATP